MAESKGGIFAKQLQKQFVRTKTKVLQNLGKAEKTKDDELEVHLTNFQKQQHDATRLQKDLEHYVMCAKKLSEASKVLQTTLHELYEEDFPGHASLQNINESLELLWLDYIQRLNASVLPSVCAYINQFPESKAKISKRGRKLVDYDNAKHNAEALMTAKKKDDSKIMKAQDDCNESKKIYDELNNDLHDELPVVYDKRIGVYASTFHTLYASTSTMHGESAKLMCQLSDILETLSGDHENGDFLVKRSASERPPRPVSAIKRKESSNSNTNSLANQSSDSLQSDEGGQALAHLNISSPTNNVNHNGSSDKRLEEKRKSESDSRSSTMDDGRYEPVVINNQLRNDAEKEYQPIGDLDMNLNVDDVIEDHVIEKPTPAARDVTVTTETNEEEEEPEPETVTSSLPQGVLFQVLVSHKYERQEEDELELGPDEIINVVQVEEEGWLLGYKVGTTQEGVFPENFTKRI